MKHIIDYELMNPFGEWLKRSRKASGWTLRELRSRIGELCSDAYLSKIENGRYGADHRVDKEIVAALADAFKDDRDRVLVLAGYAPERAAQTFPDFLYRIDFSLFSPTELSEIETFIRFKLVQKSEMDVNWEAGELVGGTVRVDGKKVIFGKKDKAA